MVGGTRSDEVKVPEVPDEVLTQQRGHRGRTARRCLPHARDTRDGLNVDRRHLALLYCPLKPKPAWVLSGNFIEVSIVEFLNHLPQNFDWP